MGAYHGGDVAAPVFREIAEQILPDLNVTPDTEMKTCRQLIAGISKPSPQQIERRSGASLSIAKRLCPKVVAAQSFSGQKKRSGLCGGHQARRADAGPAWAERA